MNVCMNRKTKSQELHPAKVVQAEGCWLRIKVMSAETTWKKG